MAGLGLADGKGIRPQPTGVGPSSPRLTLSPRAALTVLPAAAPKGMKLVQGFNQSGKVVQAVNHYFARAAPASVPLVHGSGHGGASEYENVTKEGRSVTVVGRQFFSQVGVRTTARTIGQRLDYGTVVMTPAALGGRLALLAEQFEEHKLNWAKIVYEPSVAATTAGAIAMYFRNDVATPTLDIGQDELMHASTHPSFVQTQVWEPTTMSIKPEDAQTKYFDPSSGDYRQEVQGIVQLLAASDLAIGTYGSLYIEYSVSFFGEELDYSVFETPSEVNTATLIENMPANTVFRFAFNGVVGAVNNLGPPTITTCAYVGCATVSAVSGTVNFAGPDGLGGAVRPGQTMWLGLDDTANTEDFTNGTVFAQLYPDLNSAASAASSVGYALTTSNAQNFSGAGSKTIEFTITWIPLTSWAS